MTTMTKDFSYLDEYWQKGGTYVLPVEIVNDLIGEIEELRATPKTICGIPIDEAIKLLNGLTAEKRYQMNLTIDMLSEWQKILEEEMYKSMRKSMDRQINELFGENNE